MTGSSFSSALIGPNFLVNAFISICVSWHSLSRAMPRDIIPLCTSSSIFKISLIVLTYTLLLLSKRMTNRLIAKVYLHQTMVAIFGVLVKLTFLVKDVFCRNDRLK
ncbi:hypothetical protein HanHA300_Chr09g0320281 [Helianthus annuus]|nr:hypothetical protein HanHA300_Chr09g0320281 [Helianthus annuus]KAJ0542568.1 hypothetical protein HanHA89_Chr09g0341211 [Helianthus annuus]KAJ0707619.1 hypothetical protein HanLR1_Chr09g0320491 [Helianthus annuus]KAJ0711611.1 hypothetical protein HanOQP8_Chr09g0325771 [Helianthus annuus]